MFALWRSQNPSRIKQGSNITTNSFSKKRSLSHELVTRRLKTIVTSSQTPRVSKTSDPRQNSDFINTLPYFHSEVILQTRLLFSSLPSNTSFKLSSIDVSLGRRKANSSLTPEWGTCLGFFFMFFLFVFLFFVVVSNLAFVISLWSKIIGTCNTTRANFLWVRVQCVQTICYTIKQSKQICHPRVRSINLETLSGQSENKILLPTGYQNLFLLAFTPQCTLNYFQLAKSGGKIYVFLRFSLHNKRFAKI